MDESLTLKGFFAVAFIVILVSSFVIVHGSYSVRTESSIIRVPDDYSTIQGAIDAASPGDTIYVGAGTYFEWVCVTKGNLSLIGESPDTTIIESPYPQHGVGIELSRNNVTVIGFTIRKHGVGIQFYSSYNKIEGNILLNSGMCLQVNTKNNTIRNNIMLNVGTGLFIGDSCDYNVITGNTIADSRVGLDIAGSHGNTLRGNNLTNNMYNLMVRWNFNDHIHDIDTSNTVNGRPIYYWINQHNKTVPNDAGCAYILNSTNITVKHLNLTNNGDAVKFIHTHDSVIENVHCSDNFRTMILSHSDKNIVRDNTITSNDGAIFLATSSNNTITNNTISDNEGGIRVSGGANNNVTGNTISAISECSPGILISGSMDNRIIDNNMTNSDMIFWYSATRNIISGNVISSNGFGISLEESGGNTFTNNSMIGKAINFGVCGSSLSHFIQDVDTSNTVNEKPIYYWVNQQGRQIPLDAGYVCVVNSTNITVKDLNLTRNRQGVLFARTTDSLIENVNASYNGFGVLLWESHGNVISYCTMKKNRPYVFSLGLTGGIRLVSSENNVLTNNMITSNYEGIRLYTSDSNIIIENAIAYNDYGIIQTVSSDNVIYHNNFINNTSQMGTYQSSNIWDNGCEGNYWSDYNGTDLDEDGIGDTELPSEEVDYYPLMNPYWNPADVDHDFDVDLYDAVRLLKAYGSRLGDEEYNCHCDITEPYGEIELYDAVLLLVNYGKKYG